MTLMTTSQHMVDKFFLSQIYHRTSTKTPLTACSTCLPFGMQLFLCNITLPIKSLFRRDARQLPDVVRVSNPYEEPRPPSTAVATINTIVQSSLPSEEWRELFEFRFQNFQKVGCLHCKPLPSLHAILVELEPTNNTCWTGKLC